MPTFGLNPGTFGGSTTRSSRSQQRRWVTMRGGQTPAGESFNETEEYGPDSGDELDRQLAVRDKYNQASEKRRMASIQALLGGSGGAAPPTGGGEDANLAIDENAARQTAFARAKDQAGQIARSSLDALRQNLSNTGRLGGVHEAQQTAGVLGGAANDLGEFNRDQLMADLNRSSEVSDRNYAGRLTRRGQDLSRFQSLLTLLQSNGGALY